MRPQMLRLWRSWFVLFCAVGSGCLTFGTTADASGSLPKLLADGPRFLPTWQIRPAHIDYTGDGSGMLGGFDGTGAQHVAHPGHLGWATWTQNNATGSGAVWIDDCTPDCATGTFTPHAVTLTAFRVVKGHFTRLTIRYSYRGKHYTDRLGIIFHAGSWTYYIVGYPP